MKKFILIVATTILFIFGGQTAYACACAFLSRAELEAKSEADFAQWLKSLDGAVFIGQVTKKKRGLVTFKVERYWKGRGTKSVTIYTPTSEASCGAPYQTGKKYLVFANNYKGELQSYLCGYLSVIKYKDIYLRKLGMGEIPRIIAMSHQTKPNSSFNRSGSSAALIINSDAARQVFPPG